MSLHNRVLELAVADGPLERTLEGLVCAVEEFSQSGVVGSILLLDDGGERLRLGAAPSLPAAYNAAIDGIAVGPAGGSCGTAAYRRSPVHVPDITADPLWEDYRELALAHGLAACWSVPIESGAGELLGTFALYYREPRAPVVNDLELVDFVARSAALLIERSRAVEALRTSEARLTFLDRLGAETAPLLSADEVLAATTRLMGEHLGLSVCAYADMDEDQDGFTIRGDWAAPGAASIVGHYSLAAFGTLAVTNLRAGQPLVVIDNLRELAPEEAKTFRDIGIAATICMPLVKQGRLTALMAIHDNKARDWTEAELNLLREVTERSWAHVERVAATAELLDSEARFRGVFNARLTGLTIFDARSGETLDINDTFLAMTGHSRADFDEGRWDWRDFTVPEYLPLDERAIRQASGRGWWDTYEKEYRRRDGSRFPVRLASAPLPEHPGRVVVSIQDISEARAAEAELRESEERLRLATEAAATGTWDFDPLSGALRWDDRCKALFGMRRDAEVDYDMFLAGLHPDDRAAADAAVQQALAPDGATDYAIEFRTVGIEDGIQRWIAARGRAFFEELEGARRARRFVGTVIDITDRRLAQERLRELNETLEAQVAERTAERDRIWQLSPDLMCVARTDGTLLSVNPAWERLLGWSADWLAGRNAAEIKHADDAERTAAELERLAGGGYSTSNFEDRYRHKDGSWRWISWVMEPEGQLIYCIGRDVTVEKERVAELAQAQEALRQSQKMEAMGQLTGGVAHDFNNLLTPIVGSLDMLQRRGIGGEREQRLIEGAVQSAERAKTLVQRLLAFARRQPLQAVPVEIGELIDGMADLVASTSGPRVKVEVDVAPGVPAVAADPNQLEMAILNLAVNARDAMPDGGTLTIAARPESVETGHRSRLPEGDYVRLSVADTGIGMDEATLSRAVEPFFSTKGIGKGTGLGLSMVHGLAAQLGGAMTLNSRPGVGTSVDLWLPVALSAAKPSDEARAALEVRGAGTALLVDDEELVRASTADMLSDLGYAVIEAASAEEALRLMDEGLVPDVLITDHLMPGMTGTDLAHAVMERRPAVRLLVISGYAQDQGLAPDLPRLTKPFRQAELAAKLAGLHRPR